MEEQVEEAEAEQVEAGPGVEPQQGGKVSIKAKKKGHRRKAADAVKAPGQGQGQPAAVQEAAVVAAPKAAPQAEPPSPTRKKAR